MKITIEWRKLLNFEINEIKSERVQEVGKGVEPNLLIFCIYGLN